MRRAFTALLAVTGLVALTMTPVGAQDDDPFTVNPTEGVPGDLVAANVDPAAVLENCITEIEATQQLFQTEVVPAWQAQGEGETFEEFDLIAYQSMLLAMAFGIGAGVNDGTATYLPQTFLMTFADIATQEPVGERVNFDPEVGQGQLVVPELEPGLWSIAATCVAPQITDESFAESMAAGVAFLEARFGTFEDYEDEAPDALALAAELAPEMFVPLMQPQEGGRWVERFTVLAPLPPLDPQTEAFCGVLPDLPGAGETLLAALAGIPADDDSLSDEEWADDHDWDSIGAEIQAAADAVQALIDTGDDTRVAELAPQWGIVTQTLRDALNALDAVDHDLSTPSGRLIAGELRNAAIAAGEGESDPEVDAARAALTEFYTETCVASAGADAPTTPAAPAATPVVAQPTFTG